MPRKKVQIRLEEVAEYFEDLQDPRSDVNQRHPFVSVIMIALMAVLAGADGPTAIARWAALKAEFLAKVVPLPNGVPKKDVFLRVLSALKPDVFQECFTAWLEALREQAAASSNSDRPLFAIDGKTLRRSHDRANGLGPLHSVSLWAAEYGLTLAQVACEKHSNEITAIPELLKLTHIEGAIITIDAAGTQTQIVEQIVEAKADYVITLKGNQGTLHKAVVQYIDEQAARDFRGVGARRHTTEDRGHGRVEKRTYVQLPVPQRLADQERWAGLKTIGVAMLTSQRDGKETADRRYFVSSLPMGVKQFARAIRGHWSIDHSRI